MDNEESLAQEVHDINENIVNFLEKFTKFQNRNVINKNVCLNLHKLVLEIEKYLNNDNLIDFIEQKLEDTCTENVSRKRRNRNYLKLKNELTSDDEKYQGTDEKEEKSVDYNEDKLSEIEFKQKIVNESEEEQDEAETNENQFRTSRASSYKRSKSSNQSSVNEEDEDSDDDSSVSSDYSEFMNFQNDENITLEFKQILEENDIIKKRGKGKAYCQLCRIIMQTTSIQQHDNGKKHKRNYENALRKSTEINKEQKLKDNNYIYTDITFCCRTCRVKKAFGIFEEDVYKHIQETEHIRRLPKMKLFRKAQKELNLKISSFNEKIKSGMSNFANIYDTFQSDKTLQYEAFINAYGLIQWKKRICYCQICEKLMPKEDFKSHLFKNHQVDRRNLGAFNVILYFCSFCEITFYLENKAWKHVQTSEHIKNYEKIMKKNEIIIKNKEKGVYCQLCKSYTQENRLNKHKNDKIHIKNYKEIVMNSNGIDDINKFKANNYVYLMLNIYFCKLCNCQFDVKTNIYQHIATKRHIRILEEINSCERKITEQIAIIQNYTDDVNGKDQNKSDNKKISKENENIQSILTEKIITIIGNKNQLEFFMNEKIQESNKLKNIIEYKAIKTILENNLKNIYPDVKVYLFGPRLIGLGCFHHIQNIFVDSGLYYFHWPTDSNAYIQKKIGFVMRHLQQKAYSSWTNLAIVLTPPALYAKFVNHTCDYMLNFTNGMDHSKTILINYLFDEQPICQKLCIIFIQIMIDYKLEIIFDTFVICNFVIFYLQLNNYLPSIKQLQPVNNSKPVRIGPWQVNFNGDVIGKSFAKTIITDKDRFYDIFKNMITFYSNIIDYKNEIISPFIGKRVLKKEFEESLSIILPELHNYYTKYTLKYELNMDCAICVQDLIELNYNVTQNITLEDLNKFIDCLKQILKNINW